MQTLYYLLLVVGAYLLGSVPTGLLAVKKYAGIDVRQVGSGNIGAMNVTRVAGLGIGAVTMLADALKAFIPVVVASHLGYLTWQVAIVGLAAVVGHDYSIYLRFNGGKGVASSFGMIFGLSPYAGFAALAVWALTALVFRYASVASMVAVMSMPLWLWAFGQDPAYVGAAVLLFFLTTYQHRSNIRRLRHGKEPHIGEKVTVPPGASQKGK